MKSEPSENGNEAGGRVANDRRTTTINKKTDTTRNCETKQTLEAESSNAEAETQTRTKTVSDSTKKTA